MNNFFSCKNLLLAFLSIIGLTLFSGCGGSVSTSTVVTLNSIAVTPASLTVTHGKTATLRAVGTYTDGSKVDITSQVTWVSATPETAAIGNNGIVSGVAVGNTTIMATLKGISSPTASISITAGTLSSIAISPASISLAQGANTSFSAVGTYSDGSSADISTQVAWTSVAPATATVGLNTGAVTAVALGSTTISASLSGITSPDASVTVTAATLNSIAITAAATLPKGTNTNLLATGTYSDGSSGDITTLVTWTSAAPSTATVGSHTGTVIGTAVGSTTVSATLGAVTSNTANINVLAATLSSIAITPASVSIAQGANTTLTATGTYSDSSTADLTTQVTWTSLAPATASVGVNTGVVNGTTAGSTSISATLSGVIAPSISVTVTPPVVYATWNPAAKGANVTLTNGNLTATSSNGLYEGVRATIGISSGKAYWEITPTGTDLDVGVMGPLAVVGNGIGQGNNSWGWYMAGGSLFGDDVKNPGWNASTIITVGQVAGFGLDMDAGTLRIWIDGVDKGIAYTGLTGTIYPATETNTHGITANFGATAFAYPQAGYSTGVFQ